MQPEWRILDIGAGWGSLSVALASLCREVIALESVLERARFIQFRIQQDAISNVCAIHGNLASPPLSPNRFDLATMNGVLEWLGWSDLSLNTRSVQLDLLRQVFQACSNQAGICTSESRIVLPSATGWGRWITII
ncbi:MAG: class I SAM-dependent methyltransferase [Candidatus Omnitrophica bacterium]|nr:class I SAM-dependent methyltransferase [Candidatus Omnitrophota bacterium]